MRKLADAADAEEARGWVDHLLVQGIEAEVRPAGGTELWVVDDDELDAAREHLSSLGSGEHRDVAREAAKIRRVREQEHHAHVQRFQDIGKRWTGGAFGHGILTTFLILGSVVVALMGWLSDGGVDPMWNLTIDRFDSSEPLGRVRQGEVWRLLTPMFLHFGVLHLGFNMLWLNRLGRQIEHNHGIFTMLALVIVAQVVGGLGQYWVTGPAFGGMSGVVYALFGFVWMSDRYNRRYRYLIDGASTVLIMVWFVVCATDLVGPIANIGHAGGLVVGLLFGLPAYLRHVTTKGTKPEMEDGSWAAVHLTGWRRFRRRVLDPYVPLWFLLVAAVVIAAERPKPAGMQASWGEACDRYMEAATKCLGDAVEDEAGMARIIERVELDVATMAESTSPDELNASCTSARRALEADPLCSSSGR